MEQFVNEILTLTIDVLRNLLKDELYTKPKNDWQCVNRQWLLSINPYDTSLFQSPWINTMWTWSIY